MVIRQERRHDQQDDQRQRGPRRQVRVRGDPAEGVARVAGTPAPRRMTVPVVLLAQAEPGGLTILAQQILNGCTTGMLFALIAIGYTMVYGIIELINFAHGALFMLGAFLALPLVPAMGRPAAAGLGLVGGLGLTLVCCMAF